MRAAIFGTPWWAHGLMGPWPKICRNASFPPLETMRNDCIWWSSIVLQYCITRWVGSGPTFEPGGVENSRDDLLHQSFPGCRYADVTAQKHARNLPLQQHQANFGQPAARPVDSPGLEVVLPSAVKTLQNVTEWPGSSCPMDEKDCVLDYDATPET